MAATGPSLTVDVAERLVGQHVIAVNDAYKLIPSADILYACDESWWKVHKGGEAFTGERWSSHQKGGSNDKTRAAARYGLRLVDGVAGDRFLTDGKISYGGNSGFQAVNLAILFGAARVVIVGFDMREVSGKRHFFGDHPRPLRNGAGFDAWIKAFKVASRHLPSFVDIVNATPGSAIKCFQMVDLDDEIRRPAPRRTCEICKGIHSEKISHEVGAP